MVNSNPKILVISSVSPSVGPAVMGAQIYEALKQRGLEVDFLTKYPEPGHPEYLWVVKKDNRIRRKLAQIVDGVKWMMVGGRPRELGYCFYYSYDKWPPVSSKKVIKAIKKKYDLVIVVFWQNLLSFDTIEKIFDKLHCQIQFQGVDYSHMSGGCHFSRDCQRFKTGCGMCPAFHSTNPNDFTAKNVKYRKRVYEKVRPVVGGNTYMSEFYKRSFLLKDAKIEIIDAPIVNTDIFHPIDKFLLRQKFGISDEKKYIILFGSQYLNSKKKGINYLIESFRYLYQQMRDSANSVLIITVGKNYEVIKDSIPFESRGYGYVPINDLVELYSLATIFVCPSVDDAGPMMVNQSLCCGTPVVGFDMGAVKQVVKNKGTGVCVPLCDSKSLADGMLQVFRLSADEYEKMSLRAREVALKTSSYEVQADLILKTYEKYKC